jgi:hypothetical protein
LSGKYGPPAFTPKLAHKDVSLTTALGRELGVRMRTCNLAPAEMTEGLNRGWEGRDWRTVMLLRQGLLSRRKRSVILPSAPVPEPAPGRPGRRRFRLQGTSNNDDFFVGLIVGAARR